MSLSSHFPRYGRAIAALSCAAIALAGITGCGSKGAAAADSQTKPAVLTPPQLQKVLNGRSEASMPTAEGHTPPAGSSAPPGGPKLPPQFQGR